MSHKSEQFRARQFDVIAKLLNELFTKEAHLNEYGLEIKISEKIDCLIKIQEEMNKVEPVRPSSDDRW